jgi:hypothetical protein
MRARKPRAQNRSVYDIHEDSGTGLTPLSCEKTIFYVVLADDGVKISAAERQRTAGWRVLNASS